MIRYKMSYSYVPLKLVKEIDPVYDLKSERYLPVLSAVKEYTANVYTTSNSSNQGFTVDVKTQPTDLIHPILYKSVKYLVNVAFTATAATYGLTAKTVAAAAGYGDVVRLAGPRSFPISRSLVAESIKINNGGNLSYAPNEMISIVSAMMTDEELKRSNSMTPTMLDKAHSYNVTAAQLAAGASYTVGTNSDPFGVFADMVNGINSRASHVSCDYTCNGALTIDVNGVTCATEVGAVNAVGVVAVAFQITAIEPIMISPFGDGNNKAITQVKDFQYSGTFGDLTRVACINSDAAGRVSVPANTLASITSVQVTEVKLFAMIASPKLLDKIPRMLSYPQFTYNLNKSPPLNVAANAIAEMSIGSTQCSAIPRKLIIWAEESQTDREGAASVIKASKTDTFKTYITSLQVSFNNKPGIFSQFSEEMLYNMSRENGLNMSFSEYKRLGGPVIIEFGRNLGLDENLTVGSAGNFTINVQGKYKNVSGMTLNFVSKYCIVYEGSISFVKGTVAPLTALLTDEDVYTASMSDLEVIASDKPATMFGGRSKMDSGGFAIAPLIMGLLQAAPAAVKAVRNGLKSDVGKNVLSYIDKGLDTIGMGDGGKIAGGKIAGRKAGAIMSKGELSMYLDN
jgi:hypothetical protein